LLVDLFTHPDEFHLSNFILSTLFLLQKNLPERTPSLASSYLDSILEVLDSYEYKARLLKVLGGNGHKRTQGTQKKKTFIDSL
jgi:hypothetical protein